VTDRDAIQERARVRDAVVAAYRAQGLTLEAVGQRLGCTRERVRQLQARHTLHTRAMAGEVGAYGMEVLKAIRARIEPAGGQNPGGGSKKLETNRSNRPPIPALF